MLPPATSPIHRLVHPWWQAEHRPPSSQSQSMRESLFSAALQEILDHHAIGKKYDPITDHRFRWAVQHLELIEQARKSIDEDVTLMASLAFDPTPFLSRKDLSAGTA